MKAWLPLLLLVTAAWSSTLAAQPQATRNGREIYERFRGGLAQPECAPDASTRWRKHFVNAPRDMANEQRDVMPLFGYVVDALIDASLPTEYALIPFIESGYKPGAVSPGGPAGLWQMIRTTAKNHGVPIRDGYDGRLSPVDSTKAAVRYLKTLHGMFAGDWQLAAMAYNAGEGRIFSVLRRNGVQARNVTDPETLTGVPDITRAYVRKLHALACVLDEASDRAHWRAAIDRPVPLLTDIKLPEGTSLESWAARNGLDLAVLRRMNPAFGKARVLGDRRLLAPGNARTASNAERAFWPEGGITFNVPATRHGERTHIVRSGETLSGIARRYHVTITLLRVRNGMSASSALKPGQILKID